jgi:ABC-type dipeptide/oligopeptide/nickel transport system permease component
VLVMPPLLWITNRFRRRIRAAQRENRAAVGMLNTHLQETFGGVEVIRAFGRTAVFVARFRRVLEKVLKAYNTAAKYATLYSPIMQMLMAFVIGIPAGIFAALKRNSWIDYSATFIAVLGVSINNIVLGPVLILIFGVWLKVLPIAFWGAEPPWILGFLPKPTIDFWRHAVLPVFTLGTAMSASIARLTRASLLEVMMSDYIRTARAKGLKERAVIIRHALKNSLIPVATTLGPLLAGVLTGTFVVEQIFALNGMGRQFIMSIEQREYFLLSSLTLIFSIMLVLGNLFVDVMYAWLDPRIRYD